jgi:hypothetical protein
MNRQIPWAWLACITASCALSSPAEARVNQRQNHQQQRIAQGIQKGSLTAREAVRLEKQQARINRYEARSRADGGGLGRAERKRLETMQDHASHAIRREKHDAQRRR